MNIKTFEYRLRKATNSIKIMEEIRNLCLIKSKKGAESPKIYPNDIHGSGRWKTIYKGDVEVKRVLQIMNIPFKEGNDAPRGGRLGNYIQLTPKGMERTRKARMEIIKNSKK